MIEDRLSKSDCKNGFVIDGFPRNVEQAVTYDNILEKLGYDIGFVFSIEIDRETLEKRITGRRICENCNSIYNINSDSEKPLVDSICDNCGGRLYQRKDDNVEAFNNRYNLYIEKTEPVIDHYESKGVLYKIDGNKSIKEVYNQINSIISGDGK